MNVKCIVQNACTGHAPRHAPAVPRPCRPSPPERRGRSRERAGKTEGKIKGDGTGARRNTGLHVGYGGTPQAHWRAVDGELPALALTIRRAVRAGVGLTTMEYAP